MSDITFKDFLLKFAGNLDIQEFPNHFIEDIPKITKELAILRSTDTKEINEEFGKYIEYRKNNIKESIEKKQKIVAQHEKLLLEATSWEPPTSKHAELKSYIVRKIEDIIKYNGDSKPLADSLRRLSKENSAKWWRNRIEELENQVEDYTKQYAECVDRITVKNLWKQQLIDSLKD